MRQRKKMTEIISNRTTKHMIFLSLHCVANVLHDNEGSQALALAAGFSPPPPSLSCRTFGAKWRLTKIMLQNGGLGFLFHYFCSPLQPRFLSHPTIITQRTFRVQCDSLQYCREFAISWKHYILVKISMIYVFLHSKSKT